jgi:hypothetical protein
MEAARELYAGTKLTKEGASLKGNLSAVAKAVKAPRNTVREWVK